MIFVMVVYNMISFRDRRTCSAGSLPSNSENEKFPLLFSPFPFTKVKDEPGVSRLDSTDIEIER
jgi:hypothetical protein